MREDVGTAITTMMDMRKMNLAEVARRTRVSPVELAARMKDGEWPADLLLAVADALVIPPLPLFRLAGRPHHLKALASI